MASPKCTCTTCGSQFDHKPHKTNLYCSQACYWQALRDGKYNRGTNRVHACSHCGETVKGVSHNRKRNGERADHIFCDRDCYDAFRRIRINHVYGQCKGCGCDLSRATTNSYAAMYCSHDCKVQQRKAKPKHCVNCKCHFTPIKLHTGSGRMVSYNAGKTCSMECEMAWRTNNLDRREKISKAFTGDKHPNWQGGPCIVPRGYRGPGWQAARRKALKRDGHKCIKCGMNQEESRQRFGSSLEVNHIRPFWQFNGDNQKANRLSNLETLCRSCHMKTEWEYRRAHAMQQVLPFGHC